MKSKYTVLIEKNALKQLKRIDKFQRRMIYGYIKKNLENTSDPKIQGKPLRGKLKNYWRYRVGDYRIIAEIDEGTVKIIIIKIGHRKDIYRKDIYRKG